MSGLDLRLEKRLEKRMVMRWAMGRQMAIEMGRQMARLKDLHLERDSPTARRMVILKEMRWAMEKLKEKRKETHSD